MELLAKDDTVTIHRRNLKMLAIEIYKVTSDEKHNDWNMRSVQVLHRRLIRPVSIQSWNNYLFNYYYIINYLLFQLCMDTKSYRPSIVLGPSDHSSILLKMAWKMSISIMFPNVSHNTLTTFNSNLMEIVCEKAITKYNEANYWKSTRNVFYFVTKRKHRFEDL